MKMTTYTEYVMKTKKQENSQGHLLKNRNRTIQ